MDFPEKLVAIRRERGLTQAIVAERAGMHPTQLYRYESGGAQPTLDAIRRLCVALSVSADSLLFADDVLDLVEDRLRSAYETTAYLSEHEQVVIAEVIEAFVAAHVAKQKPNLPRGPKPRRRREPGV